MQDFNLLNNFSFLESGFATIKDGSVWRNHYSDEITDENLHQKKWDVLVPIFAYHRLYLVTDGSATLTFTDSTVLKLEKGKMYLIPPFKILSVEKTKFFSHFYLHFKSNTSTIDPFEFYNLVNPVDADQECIDFFRILLANFYKVSFNKHDLRSQITLQGYFSLLVARFFNEKTALQPSYKHFFPVIEYVDNHLSEKITVKQLADLLGYTESHFSVLFSKHFKTSPLKYVTEKKMLRACQQLSLSDMTIKEISDSLGYDNEFYFNTVFKKTFGCPPGTWKKQYHNQFK